MLIVVKGERHVINFTMKALIILIALVVGINCDLMTFSIDLVNVSYFPSYQFN